MRESKAISMDERKREGSVDWMDGKAWDRKEGRGGGGRGHKERERERRDSLTSEEKCPRTAQSKNIALSTLRVLARLINALFYF